jgi:CO/xanthine dehydrogenase Mo-binding subunit
LAVDTETGEIEILQHVNVIDAGRVIYRNGAMKQNHSGIIMQQGQALMYEDIIDKQSGALLNPNMLNRKLPTTLDVRTDNGTPIFLESDDAAGPFGAHGIGEPCVSAFACIMAAFYNATGKWVSGSPLAPWKVLAALGKA